MNGAFDRRVFRRLELGTSLDWNLAQAQLDESLREVLLNLLGPRLSDTAHTRTNTTLGFLTESFQVRPTSVPSANAQITAGIGFVQNATDVPQGIGGLDGLNDVASLKPLVLKATQPLTVSAAPAFPNSRIDIVEVEQVAQAAGYPRDPLAQLLHRLTFRICGFHHQQGQVRADNIVQFGKYLMPFPF